MNKTNLNDIILSSFPSSFQEEARNLAAKALDEFDFGRSEYSVRVNSIGSGLAEADLDTVLKAKRLPKMLNLPKVQEEEDVIWVSLHHSCSRHHHGDREPFPRSCGGVVAQASG
jgi:citrate lyase beta subunit